MPIDPNIPLAVRPPQIASPFEAMNAAAQFQAVREQTEARRLAAEEARQKAKDAAAIRQVLTETNGDVEAALPRLRMIAPAAALDFESKLHEGRKQQFDALKSDYDLRGKRLDLGLKVAQSVTDDAGYQVAKPMLLALSPELAPLLPETYDPARWQQITNMGLSAKEIHDQRQEGLKLFTEGKAAEALGTFFSTARTPEEWDGIAQSAVQLGTPKALVAQFGSFSPENVARAGQLAMTPEKRATLAGAAATRAETAAHNDALEANAAAQLGISRGQLAVAQGNLSQRVAEANQPGGGKPATEGERKAAGFYGQMRQALVTLNNLEAELSDRDLYQIQSLPQEGISGAINRGTMSEAAKRYIQAFNQFTEARLRPVSGAAIADSEYARDRATYGKQYGETAELSTQRQAARVQALDALRVMGGSAITAPAAPASHAQTPYRVGDVVTVKGQKVRVTKLLADGKYEAVPVP